MNEQQAEIHRVMARVADWQMANFSYKTTGSGGYLHDYGIDAWTNATLYMGMARWAAIAEDKEQYYDWLYQIGETNEWRIPANFGTFLHHADEFCIGQFYLDMYDVYGEEKMIASTQERLDWVLANPPKPDMNYKNKQVWSWCDALFMAPPVYLRLTNLTKDAHYINFMHTQIRKAYDHLYSPDDRLFYRDDSYFEKQEQNGEKIFWGRGNGWVVAGLANLMRDLPQDDPHRSFYEKLFRDMTGRLVSLQDEQGFWHASLLDPESYPTPETSATALITYALAYGINTGLFERATYEEPVRKAWNALLTTINEEGKLGYVQPIGADPKKVTPNMTAVYGVGAFLLAGTEMVKL